MISIISIIITTILCGGLKLIKEFYSNGIIIWILQNIYYLFEAGLILLVIVFGQKYGELKFKKDNIPWGGIFLAITWGLVHILTQGFATGVYAFVMSIMYGLIFILLSKNSRLSYLIITIIFIL